MVFKGKVCQKEEMNKKQKKNKKRTNVEEWPRNETGVLGKQQEGSMRLGCNEKVLGIEVKKVNRSQLFRILLGLVGTSALVF